MNKNIRYVLYLAVIVGVLLRLALIPNPGFEADISFWKSWGLAAWDHGVVWSMHNTNNNYPTPFAYTLGMMTAIYSRFADPHIFNEFWLNTNLWFLTVSKLFPIAADLGIAALILFIGKHGKRLGFPQIPLTFYFLLSTFYLLSPVALIDGAWWGQVDSLGVLLFLLAFIFAISKRSLLAGVIFMVAMMTKLQNMIYGPLFFLFIWQISGLPGFIRAAAGATIAFFGLNIEFLLAHDMGRVVQSLTENYDYFPYLSLNAFNIWWIAARGQGMAVIDKVAAIGIVNAKTVGLLAFSCFYLFATLRQVLSERMTWVARVGGLPTARNMPAGGEHWREGELGAGSASQVTRLFLEHLIIINAAFFLFMTQSHDRYAFPLSVFLLLWAPFVKNFKRFTILYSIFTLLYFYNLHTALVLNYPHNGLPILSSLVQPALTIPVSYLHIGLFVLFLFSLLRSSRATIYLLLTTVALFLAGLAFLNKPLWMRQPVLLSNMTPFESRQDYGNRMRDMAVNSSFGITQRTRLSVQYAFYDHGIGTHAASSHTYDINKKFSRFSFDYGIDTEAGAKGTAIFEVYGDDNLLFRSEKIGRYDLPRHGEIDVRGIKYLKLATTDAGDGNTDDHTDWLNPTLWPL